VGKGARVSESVRRGVFEGIKINPGDQRSDILNAALEQVTGLPATLSADIIENAIKNRDPNDRRPLTVSFEVRNSSGEIEEVKVPIIDRSSAHDNGELKGRNSIVGYPSETTIDFVLDTIEMRHPFDENITKLYQMAYVTFDGKNAILIVNGELQTDFIVQRWNDLIAKAYDLNLLVHLFGEYARKGPEWLRKFSVEDCIYRAAIKLVEKVIEGSHPLTEDEIVDLAMNEIAISMLKESKSDKSLKLALEQIAGNPVSNYLKGSPLPLDNLVEASRFVINMEMESFVGNYFKIKVGEKLYKVEELRALLQKNIVNNIYLKPTIIEG
jgi:hypothetical protein